MLKVDDGQVEIVGTGLEIMSDLATLIHTMNESLTKKVSATTAAKYITGAVEVGFSTDENLEQSIKTFFENLKK